MTKSEGQQFHVTYTPKGSKTTYLVVAESDDLVKTWKSKYPNFTAAKPSEKSEDAESELNHKKGSQLSKEEEKQREDMLVALSKVAEPMVFVGGKSSEKETPSNGSLENDFRSSDKALVAMQILSHGIVHEVKVAGKTGDTNVANGPR